MAYQSSPVRGDLTNLVNEYALKAENFVADSVFPSASVSLQSATVSVATRESMLSPVSRLATIRKPRRATAPGAGRS